jgi:hypothetical protein
VKSVHACAAHRVSQPPGGQIRFLGQAAGRIGSRILDKLRTKALHNISRSLTNISIPKVRTSLRGLNA